MTNERMELSPYIELSRENIIQNLPVELIQNVDEVSSTINTRDFQSILFFGTNAQKKLVKFSQTMLQFTQKNDQINVSGTMGNLSDLLDSIQLDDFEEKRDSMFFKMFSFLKPSISEKISNFRQTNAKMDRLVVMLERNKIILLKDIEMLEQLQRQNEEYIRLLEVYIVAAKLFLKDFYTENNTILLSIDSEDWRLEKQKNDYIDCVEMLFTRIYELEISKEVGLQMLVQSRMLLNSNKLLVEKIQSSILTTIPIWKNQFSIMLNSMRAKQANEFTNKMSDLHKQLDINRQQIQQMDNKHFSIEELRALHSSLTTCIHETVQLQTESERTKAIVMETLSNYEKELVGRIGNGE